MRNRKHLEELNTQIASLRADIAQATDDITKYRVTSRSELGQVHRETEVRFFHSTSRSRKSQVRFSSLDGHIMLLAISVLTYITSLRADIAQVANDITKDRLTSRNDVNNKTALARCEN